MRKGAAFLALVALLVSFAACGLANPLLPYASVKADIPAVWTRDFDTVNGPVTIDVAIRLPARDTIPLLELEPLRFDASEIAALFPGANIDTDAARCFVQMGSFGACVYPSGGTWAVWPTETGDAENAELTRDDLASSSDGFWSKSTCRTRRAIRCWASWGRAAPGLWTKSIRPSDR